MFVADRDDAASYADKIFDNLSILRQENPLILNVTNDVIKQWTANVLLAIGASPVMSHAVEEIEELAGISQATVLNIGTLDTPLIACMKEALEFSRDVGAPIVLDPVGAGATNFRTEASLRFLETRAVTVLRGNASEILALAGKSMDTKGVDSQDSSTHALHSAQRLSERYGAVTCITGEFDYVVNPFKIAWIKNGNPIMTKVTGMGCAASALIGAFLGSGIKPQWAAISALTVMGVCGEIAWERSRSPGSFSVAFIDALFELSADQLRKRTLLEFL